MPLDPDTPLSRAGIVGTRYLEPLTRLEIHTVRDLLRHAPFRWENRSRFDAYPQQETETAVCISGEVVNTGSRPGQRAQVFEATLENDSPLSLGERITLAWYGVRWIAREIVVGQRLVLFGKAKRRGKRLCIEHPEFEILDENDPDFSIHFNRIVGIHPATNGISASLLRTCIHRALQVVDFGALEFAMPDSLEPQPARTAYHELHFPTSMEHCELARRSFVMEEFFGMQLRIQATRMIEISQARPVRKFSGDLARKLVSSLPFDLTGAQKRAIREIARDLASPQRMNRLLQGDVGAGKTFVALAAMLFVVESGQQAILMAPTQILAEQHYLGFSERLEPLGLRVGLRTGSRDDDSLPLFSGGPERPPDILVGTHALLSDRVAMSENGLIVIDEQHKFGVAQRSALSGRANSPDVLVMTATPIPRTLAMTVYGDLDVTILDELPKNRGRIRTLLRDATALPKLLPWLTEQLSNGRQAYVVCPAIDEGPAPDLKAAVKEFEAWKKRLPSFRCALLHGRVPSDEKERVMRQFRANEVQVLIATTVIEVGVDVPNSTVMIIENAERYGLAQLHQLRGRIGRGEHDSYCVLMQGNKDAPATARLEEFSKTTDGFRIAELDFEIRGPGDIFGTSQSGAFGLRMGDIIRDFRWMPQARETAKQILAADPLLEQPGNVKLRQLLSQNRANFATTG